VASPPQYEHYVQLSRLEVKHPVQKCMRAQRKKYAPSDAHWETIAAIRATANDPSAAGVRACESRRSSSTSAVVLVVVIVTTIMVGSDLPVTLIA